MLREKTTCLNAYIKKKKSMCLVPHAIISKIPNKKTKPVTKAPRKSKQEIADKQYLICKKWESNQRETKRGSLKRSIKMANL